MQADTQTEKEPKRPTVTQKDRQTDRVNSKLYSTGIVV